MAIQSFFTSCEPVLLVGPPLPGTYCFHPTQLSGPSATHLLPLLCYCEAKVSQTCREPASKDFPASLASPVMVLGVPSYRGGLPTEWDQLRLMLLG